MGPNEEQLFTAQLKQTKKDMGHKAENRAFVPFQCRLAVQMTFKRCDLEDKIK